MPQSISRRGKATAFHLPYEFSRSPLPARITRANFENLAALPSLGNKYGNGVESGKEVRFFLSLKKFFREIESVAKKGESFLEEWSDTNLPHGLEDWIRDVITTLPKNHGDWAAARRALAENGAKWLKDHPEPVVETITSLPEQGPLLISLNGQHQLVDQILLEPGTRLPEASKRSTYTPVDFHQNVDGAPTTVTTESGQTVYYAHTETDNEAMKVARTKIGAEDLDVADTTLPGLPAPTEETTMFPFPLRKGDMLMTTPVRDTTEVGMPPRVFFPPPSEGESFVASFVAGRSKEKSDIVTDKSGEEQAPILRQETTRDDDDDVSSGQQNEDSKTTIAKAQEINVEHEAAGRGKDQHTSRNSNETEENMKYPGEDKGKGKATHIENEGTPEELATLRDEQDNVSVLMELATPILSAVPAQRGRGRGRRGVAPAAPSRVPSRRTPARQPAVATTTARKPVSRFGRAQEKERDEAKETKVKEEVKATKEKEKTTRPTRTQKTIEKPPSAKPPSQREPTAGPSRTRVPATPVAPPTSRATRTIARRTPAVAAKQPIPPPTATRGTKRGRGQVEPAATAAIQEEEEERPTRRLRSRKHEDDE